MDVYDDDQLVRGGLEEKMLHVTEEDINLAATMVVVAETVVMDLKFTSNALAVQARPGEDVIKAYWLTVWGKSAICFQDGIGSHTSNNTELVLLNHVFQLFLLLFPTNSVLSKVGYLL